VVAGTAPESTQDDSGLFPSTVLQHGDQLVAAANSAGLSHPLDALQNADVTAEKPEGSLIRLKELYRRASVWGILFLLGAAAVVAATAISVASFAPWSQRVSADVPPNELRQSQQGVLTDGSVSSNAAVDQSARVGALLEPAAQASASTASINSQTLGGPQAPNPTAKMAAETAVSKNNTGKPSNQATTVDSPTAAASVAAPVMPEVAPAAEPAQPQDVCAKKSVFLQNACISEQCSKSSMSNHPHCQRLRKEREREEFNQLYGSP
jgi:hypothetical protein